MDTPLEAELRDLVETPFAVLPDSRAGNYYSPCLCNDNAFSIISIVLKDFPRLANRITVTPASPPFSEKFSVSLNTFLRLVKHLESDALFTDVYNDAVKLAEKLEPNVLLDWDVFIPPHPNYITPSNFKSKFLVPYNSNTFYLLRSVTQPVIISSLYYIQANLLTPHDILSSDVSSPSGWTITISFDNFTNQKTIYLTHFRKSKPIFLNSKVGSSTLFDWSVLLTFRVIDGVSNDCICLNHHAGVDSTTASGSRLSGDKVQVDRVEIEEDMDNLKKLEFQSAMLKVDGLDKSDTDDAVDSELQNILKVAFCGGNGMVVEQKVVQRSASSGSNGGSKFFKKK
ncbi:hypothetical protein HK098_001632 [Nowakowskiella sp. JEL0407]|nr:hypothetical protein HK098_001632 [Nowakowskiella sp. JEL0407]